MASFEDLVKFFVSLSIFNTVFSFEILSPCNVNDDACVAKSVKMAYPLLMSGIPKLGIESSDPMHLEKVEGQLSVLKFKLTNSTLTGLKNCEISNIKFNLEKSKFNLVLICNDLVMYGDYEMNGRLIVFPIEGKGPFRITVKKYYIGIDTDLNRVEGEDGKTYLSIEKFKLQLDALDTLTFKLDNLFKGRKRLADAVLGFINESWKEVAGLLQEPLFNENVKKMVAGANKFLQTMPIEELILE